MADYYMHMSTLFDPGKGNIDEALRIYGEMQDRLEYGLGIIVEEEDGQLWLHHEGLGRRYDAVDHAVGFVAECARRFGLSGTWMAEWSNLCCKPMLDAFGGGAVVMDLETQAVLRMRTEDMIQFLSKMMQDEVVAHARTFIKVPLPTNKNAADAKAWLKENGADDWADFQRAVAVAEDSVVTEQVFLFKTNARAVEFKLRFS